MVSYYNTNNEGSKALESSEKKAKSQEEIILEIFRSKQKLSASQTWAIYDSSGMTPITSIRRAITNLCKNSKLVKTADTINGLYGKQEHIYKLHEIDNSKAQLQIF